MKNIVILISGRGSNMEAVVHAAREEQWPAHIAAVISNKADAKGLEFAQSHGIPTAVVANKEFATREAFDAALQETIDRFAPDLVVLAGFMRILTPGFVAHYRGRMLNIHPSLLPLFPGLHTHQQALDAGVAKHGATVHFVTAELDHGPAVLKAEVDVLPGDTPDTLAARVLVQEHTLYPRAIRLFVEDRLSIDNGDVRIAAPTNN
ncbi:phosphoribosylglycinamide formyltransferase [Massilia antarctica]|uniref:phosphoribosylglycinamide formyltransferase n=1 Tax=Massilia antarctica TaxID=2765360 RepID=UPI0006BB992E|nr:phosphoribosylglycinamide formyltransferase [Massilia sp. H27-R4]MCY0911274.1 phosphoribosylglycinamide formyltransferase [Massilia sp. H27-R4]CUI05131.1 Phosphoribosylglycinamide formyltransferase [Janthinobacterium sp. CG23_2]CUU28917.1 Phosphoribosylglycinamide formyltransferase [Janthinobacterium sp. CG23_2]